MTNYEISRLLLDYRAMKKITRDLRVEMLRVVVDEIRINRKEAQQSNLETFLDGYLVGQDTMQSSRKISNYEISGLLHHYQQIKKSTRELRLEMLRIAVEDLGLDQSEALQANLEEFLDGYLVGRGMIQSWRKCGT